MGHDLHFLSRLERVSLPHVELALSLYRDPQLLRFILDSSRIAEQAERVAISLGDPERGPFLVVARDGHFVTCLGEDMSPGDLPIITRTQLDGLAHKVSDLRARLEVARTLVGPRGQVSQLLRRIVEAGPDMSREEFIGVSAWQPLLRREFLTLLFEAGTQIADARALLRTDRRPRPRDEPLLRALWNTFWSMGHLVLLVALGGPEMVESLPPELIEFRSRLSWAPVRQGRMSLALRGAWAVGRLGKPMLAAYKQGYARAGSQLQAINMGMGLLALGARHSRLRAEARKALSLTFEADDELDATTIEEMKHIEKTIALAFDQMIEQGDTFEQLMRWMGAAVYLKMVPPQPEGTPYHFASQEMVPETLALAAVANNHSDFLNQPRSLIDMMLFLPWVARAKAEDLYFPQELLPHVRLRWRPEDTLTLLGGPERYYGKKQPHRAEPKPGRNAPCPCKSGKKYKNCCGG